MAQPDSVMPSFDNGLNLRPAQPINNPTFTLPDFTVPPLESGVDLAVPSAVLDQSSTESGMIANHLTTEMIDLGVDPLDVLARGGQEDRVPDVVSSHVDTHVFDPGVPPLTVPPDMVPDYPNSADLRPDGPIRSEVTEGIGAYFGNPGPDGDGDDDDSAMPPYTATNSTPGLTHRERHLDPLYEGLKGEVPVGPAPGDKGIDMTPVFDNTPPLPAPAQRGKMAWQA